MTVDMHRTTEMASGMVDTFADIAVGRAYLRTRRSETTGALVALSPTEARALALRLTALADALDIGATDTNTSTSDTSTTDGTNITPDEGDIETDKETTNNE